LDLDPGLAPDAGEEILAILGPPTGLGGDAAGVGHAMAAHLAGADPERFDGPIHGRAGERPARADALAQPDDSRKGIDDAKRIAVRPRHQQSAVVRAEIERGQHCLAVADANRRPRAIGFGVDVSQFRLPGRRCRHNFRRRPRLLLRPRSYRALAPDQAGSADGACERPAGLKLWPSRTRLRAVCLPSPSEVSITGPLLGDRLAVGLRTLTPPTLVRIQVPQPLSPCLPALPRRPGEQGRNCGGYDVASRTGEGHIP